MPEAIRDHTGGDPSKPRATCSTCGTHAYAVEIPLRTAEQLVKQHCPRKARCQDWRDRGCKIERVPGVESSHENMPALPQADPGTERV